MPTNKLTKKQKQLFIILGFVTIGLYYLNEYTDYIYNKNRAKKREEQLWNEFKENSNAAYIQHPEYRIDFSETDSLKTDSIIHSTPSPTLH